MKKIYNLLLCGLVLTSASCNKFLDVNSKNPNSPTSSSVDLVLPQALAATASTSVTFNSYGAWAGGFQANAGGFGGFGSVLTYNYTTSDNNGLWSQSYDNINDYQYIINNSQTTGTLKNFNAVARVMKVFAYQRLVDVYGDVPYTQAVKGLGNLTPAYDKAEAIYTDLFKQLDTAITTMNIPSASTTQLTLAAGVNGTADNTKLSGGGFDMTGWIKFANTLRLRLAIRIQAVPSMAAVFNAEKAKLTALSTANFITADVSVQPGYVKVNGKQNPAYNAYSYNSDGTATQISTLPTIYARGFYDGYKLQDDIRYALTYNSKTAFNQLGYTGSDAPSSPSGGVWLVTGKGIIKGLDAPYTIMLNAEGQFLQAEGSLVGILPGGVTASATRFNAGIAASFKYLHTLNNGSVEKTDNEIIGEVNTYIASNNFGLDAFPRPYLAVYSRATTDAQRLEAIITQKWIALNYLTSNEAFAEYRRTGYPTVDPQAFISSAGIPDPLPREYTTFASLQSTSPRADKLPVRVLYPQSEYSLNPNNAPSGIDTFTSRIFWDLN